MAPRVNDHGVRIRGKKRRILEQNAIECSKYDKYQFEHIKNISRDLKKQDKENTEIHPTFPDLHQDIFDSLYKAKPQEVESKHMKPGWEANWDIMKAVLDDKTYKELRMHTTHDEFNAALATKTITEGVLDLLPDVKTMPRAQRKKGDPPDDPNSRKPDKKKLGKALNNAMGQAAGECKEMSEAVLSWGTGSGIAQRLTHDEKINLAKRIHKSSKLKELAKMVGRFKNLAISTQRTKVKKGTEEVHSIEIGDDLGRMLDDEMVNLGHRDMKYDFYRRALDGELLQFALRDRMKESKGPIVACIDNSGSMSGEPEIWAKAVALGLLEICTLQRRNFVGIHFSSGSEARVFNFKLGEYAVLDVIDFAEFFYGGGTDFERPLDMAAKVIDDDMPKADIVMITDGICDVGDQWLMDFKAWRDEAEVTVFSIIIDTYSHYASSWKENHEGTIKKFSNGQVLRAADIQEESGMANAGEIFGYV
ncbi:hypothetical protein LCGC14_0810300 [marine sediment metagenome]|uniref:VWFA domain-containing protein n=1 Tax=marine sediment metagenome TaxID=412755 RepID=A0A0F9PM18_9ZZZZ